MVLALPGQVGMMTPAIIPALESLRAEDLRVQASLGNIAPSHPQNKTDRQKTLKV